MARRLASISVDLDSLPHYCRIHGLPESLLDARARGLVYTTAVPRLRQLLAEVGVPGTFFAIGEDVAADAGAAAGSGELVEFDQQSCETVEPPGASPSPEPHGPSGSPPHAGFLPRIAGGETS